jgi:hypothetical protein
MTRRSFGYIRRLPSKRYQASYIGPDLARHAAPDTFEATMDAEGWLRDERTMVASGVWIPPKRRAAVAGCSAADTLPQLWVTVTEPGHRSNRTRGAP